MRLRLRHKLALMLSLAALLPVAGASSIAVQLVIDNVDRGKTRGRVSVMYPALVYEE